MYSVPNYVIIHLVGIDHFYTFAPIKTIKQKTVYEKGIGTPF